MQSDLDPELEVSSEWHLLGSFLKEVPYFLDFSHSFGQRLVMINKITVLWHPHYGPTYTQIIDPLTQDTSFSLMSLAPLVLFLPVLMRHN